MTPEPVLRKYWPELVLAGILLVSAFLSLWNIWAAGYTNAYYAAAVKSMLENPGLLFFNAFDAGGFITVDKPPVGLWVQAASALVFGFSGWSLVLPQALAGVASVALLYCIVSRPFGKPAGLIAAFTLAVTPIFVAVSRNETPDGLLIFVILLAVWAALKAARENSLPYLLLAVTLAGIGFNIKMIQAFIVVPAILAVYLLGAKEVPGRKRILHAALAVVVLLAVSLSWAAVVDSIPADQRPFIGGSGDNTVMGLIVNYNGIHRLESDGQSPGGGSGPQAGMAVPDNRAGQRSDGLVSGTGSTSGQGMPYPPGSSAGGQDGPGGMPPSSASVRNQSTGMRDAAMPAGPGSRAGPAAYPGDSSAFSSGPGMAAGAGAPGGRTGGGMMDDAGSPGVLRLFGSGLYGQISWLLPFALIGLLAWVRRPAAWNLQGIGKAGYFSERGLTLFAFCLWLFPGLLYFSFTTGFWHTYYLATIAPPLAAVAGISAAGMYRMFAGGGVRAWLLPAAVLITGLAGAVFLLGNSVAWTGTLAVVVAAATVLLTAALAVMVFTRRTPTGILPKVVIALAAGLLFAGPCIWAGTTLHAGGNILPVAGPQAMRGTGGMPGGNMAFESTGESSGLTGYLLSHKGGETWIVAVASSHEASGIILSTGEAVMALGGFAGSDQVLTTGSLADLITTGKIRYFYLGSTGSRGGPDSGSSAVSSWVNSHCTVVPASEYGGRDSAGEETGLSGGLSGGAGTLYDCRNATA